jgi:hypothetical protein
MQNDARTAYLQAHLLAAAAYLFLQAHAHCHFGFYFLMIAALAMSFLTQFPLLPNTLRLRGVKLNK